MMPSSANLIKNVVLLAKHWYLLKVYDLVSIIFNAYVAHIFLWYSQPLIEVINFLFKF